MDKDNAKPHTTGVIVRSVVAAKSRPAIPGIVVSAAATMKHAARAYDTPATLDRLPIYREIYVKILNVLTNTQLSEAVS